MNDVKTQLTELIRCCRGVAAAMLLASLMSVFAAPVAIAQESAAEARGKIAVVSLRSAILKTERAQASLQALESRPEFKEDLEEYKELRDEIRGMMDAYQKDRAVMSAEKRSAEEKRIVDKRRDFEFVGQKIQQAQQEWEERAMDEQSEATLTVLKNLVEERDIGLLIRADSGMLLHADDAYDISDEVTERLNRIE